MLILAVFGLDGFHFGHVASLPCGHTEKQPLPPTQIALEFQCAPHACFQTVGENPRTV